MIAGNCDVTSPYRRSRAWQHNQGLDIGDCGVLHSVGSQYLEQLATSSAHHHSLSLNTIKEQLKTHLFEKKTTNIVRRLCDVSAILALQVLRLSYLQ